MIEQLHDLADSARRNAEAQRVTSSTLGLGGGGGLPATGAMALSYIDVRELIRNAWGLIDWGWGSDGMGGARRATDATVPIRDLPGDKFDNDWAGRSILFDNDWAGRSILARYLEGGDDWTISNDPAWTNYMEANPTLTTTMQGYNDQQAKAALQQYLASGQSSGQFSTTTDVAMENGESIVGYQYLHGTNAEEGGFQHSGNTSVEPLPDGTYRVTVASNYVWNDVIDPNPIYSTDRSKSALAEIMTFGRADAYDIHIGWSGTTTVIMDANGNVISGEGWPPMRLKHTSKLLLGAAVASLLISCTAGTRTDTPFLQKGQTQTSPSGSYKATLRERTDQGVTEYQPVITDSDGTVVWEDKTAFVERYFPGVTWQTDTDVLWILSSDVGNSRVEIVDDTWVQTFGSDGMPDYIAKWVKS